MERDIEALKKITQNDQILSPYIKYIRFPYIKNLKPDLKLKFTFPITALVGQNGTNKSTILRCLFGCPGKSNTANFWFSTKVDPIDESNGRARYIYCYYQPDAKRDVEVLKTRIRRKNRNDEWETSRPLRSDDMENMPDFETGEDGEPILHGRTKTRWNPIEKNVAFLDFRSELSAYDKYFYFADFKRSKRINTRQDYIRKQSIYLHKIIQQRLQQYECYNHNHVLDNRFLQEKQVEYVSTILGRNYSKINIIQHTLFKGINGISVVLHNKKIHYSEAFAGSGEFSVVMLVDTICSLPEKSLILLDEPEVSLHPGAQQRLLEFLVQQVKSKKHQIVFGTHSPYMVRGLPPDAIKNLFLDPSDNNINLTNYTLEDEAFFHLGVPASDKILILVEDRLAKELVQKALRTLGEALHTRFSVKPVPGGAETLLMHHLPSCSELHCQNIRPLFIIDGDRDKHCTVSSDENLQKMSNADLEDVIKYFFGGKLTLSVDGGSGKEHQEQKRRASINALCYLRDYTYFLPSKTPEAFILEHTPSVSKEEYDQGKEKDYFKKKTIEALGKKDYEPVNSQEILETQRRMFACIPDSNDEIVKLAEWLRKHLTVDN